MNDKEPSSGFVDSKIPQDKEQFTDIRCIHVSSSGFNSLYQCQHHGKKHVLKALDAGYVGDDFFETLLRKEFNIGFQLEHPHICRTLGLEQVPGMGNCILLEYIDGITLKELIAQRNLTREIAYKIVTELCLALQYLHSKQIIHRDLKPTNILVTHNGNNVKLIDFGLADSDDYDIMKEPAGTRYYIAPEILKGGVALDLRADIYSLGIIIGEMAEALHDRHLAVISRKCTQQKREKRYASTSEIIRVLNQKPVNALVKYGVSLAALVLLAAGIWLWQDKQQEAPATVFSLPVYGNCAVSDDVRSAMGERLILHESQPATNHLQQVFDKEYPLHEMRQTIVYTKQWEQLSAAYGE